LVAYARVSTEKQEISLEAQAAKFEAYGLAQEAAIVAVESDELSGKNTSREGLQRALAMLERGEADGLLVTKLDRLTRSTRDGEELVEKYFVGRFVLLSVSDPVDTRTAVGRFVLRLMISLGQLERETTVERTKDALAHLRATGKGTPRLEGAAIARARELQAEGLSLRAIAARLTEEGVPTLKGGKWAAETVRKVLVRT
jgi:DNA invertase Pin-like site-specific DNA recombinase